MTSPQCIVGGERTLTAGEITLVRSVFGDAVDCGSVLIKRRKWFVFQPCQTVMAPCGHLHFHPKTTLYQDDFSESSWSLKGLFIHEMTHIWQAQQKGRWYLPLMRHPFCSYKYTLKDGRKFGKYGLEQQAEIVRHAFLLQSGVKIAGIASMQRYQDLLPF